MYKEALGIPISSSNERFEAMGIHNTLDEITEAEQSAQFQRPLLTGGRILHTLHIYLPRR